MKVPETPLSTPAVLSEEREQWGDMQVRRRFCKVNLAAAVQYIYRRAVEQTI